MGRRRSPARLVVALSVAAALAIFILYTSIAGNATPTLQPSQLRGHSGQVELGGRVVGPVRGDSYARTGKRFTLRDVGGTTTVRVVYHGTVPDLFKVGRHVNVSGTYAHGTIAANGLTTKCPSKYAAAKTT